MRSVEERRRELQNYRGRRLRACQAAQDLHDIIAALGNDDGSELPPPDGALPPAPNEGVKRELQNSVANLLRLILLHNDGRVSPQKLQRF